MGSALTGWGKRADLTVHESAPLNCEPAPALLADEITATAAFYCRNHGPIPAIDVDRWRLRIDGVPAPRTLNYRQLTGDFAARELTATMACAGLRRAELAGIRPLPGKEPWAAGAISTATWRGAALADVLAAAGVTGSADGHVAFTGDDVAPGAQPPQHFGGSIPLAAARSGEVLLVWAMNGTALPRIHGGPVRVVAPGLIGARSVKWLTSIRVQDCPSDNYFQAVDYRLLAVDAIPAPGAGVELSTLRLNTAILFPVDHQPIPVEPLTIRGYAIGPDCRRIARVQVIVNGVAHHAELSPPVNRWTWRHWSVTVAVTSGPVSITAGAIDDTGTTQPSSAAALWNPGGYANNARAHIRVIASRQR